MSSARPISSRPWWLGVLAGGLGVLYFAHVVTYLFVSDDAYISFRYAQHLVQGHGLVFNPGEAPVEGYTNFLWVVLVAAFMGLGVPPEAFAVAVGVASGGAILVLITGFSARRLGITPWILAPAGLLVCSRSFAAWSTGGLETSFFALLVLASVLAFLHEREQRIRRPIYSSVLLALATLTRPEGALFTAVIGTFFAYDVVRFRRSWRDLLIWATPWVLVVGSHLLFRQLYYEAWLPDTFHAKVNDVFWGKQALRYWGKLQRETGFFAYGWLALLPALLKRDLVYVLMTALLVTFALYVTAIGGDRFEFRFLVFVMPMAVWLLTEGLRLAVRWPPLRWVIVVILGGLIATQGHLTATHDRGHIFSVKHMAAYADRRAKNGMRIRRLIDDGFLPEDLRLCTGGAGALPYYARVWTLDYFGLNDEVIASRPVRRRGIVDHEHRASGRYMVRNDIDIWDVTGTLLPRGGQARPLYAKALRRSEALGKKMRPVCMVIDRTRLIFATPLDDETLRARFGPFTECSFVEGFVPKPRGTEKNARKP